MLSSIHVNSGWVIATLIASLFAIIYPFALALIAHRRLKVSWKYFAFGLLIFLIFQVLTRVPAVTILGRVLAPKLNSSTAFLYTWLAILALSAGLFEEIGRYLGYRWFMGKEEKTWSKAVMYGLGHGGLESMLLVGGLSWLTLVNVVVLSSINLNSLPAATHAQVVQQINAINAEPVWLPLLSAWERLWAIPVQVALSVIVLQVFRRESILWLVLAILAHAVFDFITVALVQVLGSSKISTNLIVELIIALVGLGAIWVLWALRDRTVVSEVEQEPQLPGVAQ
ncbi:MAG TPA: YhfC family glutamic-type intramembrane protease [Ktedonobacteraceae bacterium]|nr:YhfC family glutamic-type intramembrane protease [Ktedonobacteraceae bacterium]